MKKADLKRLYRPDFTIKEPSIPKLVRVEVEGKPFVRVSKRVQRLREAVGYYRKGYDFHDIAVMMGISETDVKRLTKKARIEDKKAAMREHGETLQKINV